MGKKTTPPPPAPDYAGAAVAQGASNLESARATAKLSNPNTYTPYGTQLVSYDGDVPTIRQTLTPQAQQTLEAEQRVQTSLAKLGEKGTQMASTVLDKPFTFGGPAVQTSLDTSNIARAPINAGTTGFDAIMSRLEPSMARARTSTETNLVNQGLRPGTEAYDNAIRSLGEQETDARTQAARTGIDLDTAANTNQFNQLLQGGQFGNTAQQQALAQAISQRQMPLNEITALMSGSQIQNPTFGAYQGANVAAAPTFAATQAQGDFDKNSYNTQVAQSNANTAALYSLGGSAMKAFSDQRLKSNIVRLGTHPVGVGIYEYDIFNERQVGVMAQELMEVMPEAVTQHSSGYYMVDYGRLNANS